jgi:plastocyanin
MDGSSLNVISIVSGASAMGDKAFAPNPISVKTGDIVTWKNTDIETHAVTSADFDSGLLDPAQSFEYKFENVGHYHYSCMIHPSMNGEVIVS